MGDFFFRFVEAFWELLLDTGFWLLAGFLLAGVVHVLIPNSILTRHLSGRGVMPLVKASLLGIPLPLCSCSVIPVAAGLRRSGASRGASAAFAISTPQTGEESVPLTWALFGPVYALARPVLAVATAFTAGLLIEMVGEKKPRSHEDTEPRSGEKACCSAAVSAAPVAAACCGESEPVEKTEGSCCAHHPAPAPVCCCEREATWGAESSCCSAEPAQETGACCCAHDESARPRSGVASHIGEVFRYGFGTMMRDLAIWLAVGLLLSALISALVPAGWIESHIGTGLVPMLLMLLVGMPLYVCATSTTPLAYTLVVAGLSPGAGLVLLLAGPATNAATMSWVLKDLGVRALVVYLATIAVFAVAGGVLFDTFLAGTVRLAEMGVGHAHPAVTWVQIGGAVVFAALLLWSLVARWMPGRRVAMDACPAA